MNSEAHGGPPSSHHHEWRREVRLFWRIFSEKLKNVRTLEKAVASAHKVQMCKWSHSDTSVHSIYHIEATFIFCYSFYLCIMQKIYFLKIEWFFPFSEAKCDKSQNFQFSQQSFEKSFFVLIFTFFSFSKVLKSLNSSKFWESQNFLHDFVTNLCVLILHFYKLSQKIFFSLCCTKPFFSLFNLCKIVKISVKIPLTFMNLNLTQFKKCLRSDKFLT